MAKHKFLSAFPHERGNPVSAQCARCAKIVLLVNGQVPIEVMQEECRREDVNQAAARVVREVTEK